MALPSRNGSIGVIVTLWRRVEIVHNVNVLKGRGTIIALNEGMPFAHH